MSLSPLRVLRAARALWARDRAILGPLSGLFFFVPQWAVLMLVSEFPRMPVEPDQAATAAWSNAFIAWAQANAGVYLVAALASQFGTLAVATLYVGPGAGAAGTALARAGALFGRFLLAVLLVWLPVGPLLSVLIGMGGVGVAMGLMPILYVVILALTMPIAPAVATGDGAVRAITRAWTMTRGSRAGLAALAAAVVITSQLVAAVLLAIGHDLVARGAGNPIVLALIDAAAAAMLWGAALALALSGVIVYRALAR